MTPLIQDSIVYAIILGTVGYIVFNLFKPVKKNKPQNACGGCTGCASKQVSCSEKKESPILQGLQLANTH